MLSAIFKVPAGIFVKELNEIALSESFPNGALNFRRLYYYYTENNSFYTADMHITVRVVSNTPTRHL